jgi:hypothetical protein
LWCGQKTIISLSLSHPWRVSFFCCATLLIIPNITPLSPRMIVFCFFLIQLTACRILIIMPLFDPSINFVSLYCGISHLTVQLFVACVLGGIVSNESNILIAMTWEFGLSISLNQSMLPIYWPTYGRPLLSQCWLCNNDTLSGSLFGFMNISYLTYARLMNTCMWVVLFAYSQNCIGKGRQTKSPLFQSIDCHRQCVSVCMCVCVCVCVCVCACVSLW